MTSAGGASGGTHSGVGGSSATSAGGLALGGSAGPAIPRPSADGEAEAQGCGCRTVGDGEGTTRPAWLALMLVALGALRRREVRGARYKVKDLWRPAGTAGAPVVVPVDQCAGEKVTTPKRVVRLSEQQIASTYRALFGDTATATMLQNEDLKPITDRPFPPLEGAVVNSALVSLADRMAKAAGTYVAANLMTATTCGAMPTADCGQMFLQSFAAKAFRRPLQPEETQSITGLWGEVIANGGSVNDAIQYGVNGILTAPGFIYRTEFGTDPLVDGPLNSHEMASAVSYFLTDGPPDADLLTAAAANQLATAEQVKAHADRLLATPKARTNFEAALLSYFAIQKVLVAQLDENAVPGFPVTDGVKNSLYREAELFMQNTLWAGPLGNLFTSRRTWVNNQIAPVYGLPAPSQDPQVFMPVDLPADRSGLLTLAPFLTTSSRPDTGSSPVIRGLAINMALVCQVNPPFPEDDPVVVNAIAATHDLSQKEQYEFRKGVASCAGCHSAFDAFGMVLEPYDAIGRYRTMDLQGRPIDASWTVTTMPERFGGAPVNNVRELTQALLDSGALNSCMAMNLMNFALGDVSQGGANLANSLTPSASCAVKEVVDRFKATDQSFTSLIREIAASETLTLRTKGK